MPGGGCRLTRPTGSLSRVQTSQARASAAPPGKISDTVPVISPGGGCLLTRPTGSSHSLIPVGPRKRSAAGQDIRHGSCNFAGWRLRLARPTGASHRLKPRRPRAGAAPPGKISGTVPVISPGGGCRLTRPTESSYRLKPRRPAQAQRRRA